jgi:hypothetical protein
MARRAWAAAILLWSVALLAPAAPRSEGPKEAGMVEVTIDLQDGFKDDTVVISAGGRELVREQAVSTRFQIGKAKSLRVALPEGQITLTVEVPTQNRRATVPLDTTRPVFVGVSLTTEGELEVRTQAQPFGYL